MKLLSSTVVGYLLGATQLVKANGRPNILFILTDDQDWYVSSLSISRYTQPNSNAPLRHMGSLSHMPLLQKYLLNEGTLYSNHYCTVALCCPSRVNLWTGRAAHNTNVCLLSHGSWVKMCPLTAYETGHGRMGSFRRVPQGSTRRHQRQLPPALDASCWL